MPIISLGSGAAEGAGAGAAAFRQASASATQLLARQRGQQDRMLFQRMQDVERNALREEQLSIQGRQVGLREDFERRQREVHDRRIGQEGAAVLTHHRELMGLNPERAEEIHRQVAELVGSDFDGVGITPEGLSRHPQFPRIQALVNGAWAEARTSDRESRMFATSRGVEEAILTADPQWAQTIEGQDFMARAGSELALAETPEEARRLARSLMRQGIGQINDRKMRADLQTRAEDMLRAARTGEGPSVEAEVLDEVLDMIGDIRTEDDAQGVFDDISRKLDPNLDRVARRAEQKAREQMEAGLSIREAKTLRTIEKSLRRVEEMFGIDLDVDGILSGTAASLAGQASEDADPDPRAETTGNGDEEGPPTVGEFPGVALGAGAVLRPDSVTSMVADRLRVNGVDWRAMPEEEQREAFRQAVQELEEELGPLDAMSRHARDLGAAPTSTIR